MMNNSFTLGYAHALRDATLSLSGKGLVCISCCRALSVCPAGR